MDINARLRAPIDSVKWVPRDSLIPNDYNPNKVSQENLKLLTRSIIVNGFTLPIVIRPDMTIEDGFHRWTVSGPEWKYVPSFSKREMEELSIDETMFGKTVYELLGGMVPTVTVTHKNTAGYMYGTITHNRARGTHMLEPMKAIVKRLMDAGHGIDEIGAELGMKPEEVFRLSDFSKEDFLAMMSAGKDTFSKAQFITRI